MFMVNPLIIGHRGAAKIRPENTLPSFHAGFENTHAVEFDLWLSKDNIPFVFHDGTLDRTTEGTGFTIKKTFAELQKFDAGFHFDPEKNKSFPFRGQGIKIPSFEELLGTFSGKYWCVEIKQNSPELVHETVKLLKKYKLMNDCVIGSKHHLISETMRQYYPQTPRFYSQREIVLSYLDYKRGASPKPDPYGVASLPIEKKCGMDFTEAGYIDYLHAKNARVYYWTVNAAETMEKLAARKADGLIGDDPSFAASVFRRGTGPRDA